jgi:ABC-2 type transport system ATP-binding protein
MTLQDVMIETSGLTRFFGPRKAIEGLSFSITRGEAVALLGTNGSGKTTTMRILSGYLPPTAGAAAVAGFDIITHSLDVRKAVGYLPEDVPLYTDLTVEDSLRFFGRLRKMRGANLEHRINDVIEQVGLGAYRDVLILKLSKGYRQRTGLAIAILHDPEVLILDEPTVSIDPLQVSEIRNLIRSLTGQHTILLSTHHLSEAAELCDRAVVLNGGRVVADGPIADITATDPTRRRLRIKIEGDNAVAAGSLARIENVSSVENSEPSYQTPSVLTVIGSGARLYNDVIISLVHEGIVIESVTEDRPSLESAFLDLARAPEAGDFA